MPLFPSSAIGRALMLLSATLFGTAAGVARERASGKRLQHEQEFVPMRDAEQMDAARMVLSPFMQQTVSKGLPSDERLRFFDGFVASLNYERRIPNWVLEYFPSPAVAEATAALRGEEKEEAGDNEEEGPNGARRGGIRFFADTTVPEAFRVTPDDYTGGREQKRLQHTRGLSRGHLAAAQFHKHSTKEMAETFNMNANVVPQDMTMNALDWLRLENLMKKLLLRYEGGIWVVTGPVFSPRYVYGDPRSWGWTESRSTSAVTPATTVSGVNGDMKKARKVVCYELVGKHDVAVPTHLFKVVLGERGDGSHEVAAFLIPNEPIVSERPLVAYQVPVTELEKRTGLQFFQKVVPANDTASTSWRGRKAQRQGLDALPNICRRMSCEARTVALFQTQRSIAQLRAAQSLPELQQVFTRLLEERRQQRPGEKRNHLDTAVMREYEDRRKELAEEALSEGK
ncbi:putative endonuclease G [Trypanosoma cruzi]|uniref:Endonuclease G n=1 Tax=Trypanosoma cruzi TaxID=5693 RepID=A0A7J6YBE5_TRYCR|nr:hypothetical protein ECC02_003103 [Trypanosoma cruzi]KAF8299796.1 putative endonuclease G [Trypanosoma cruzi]